MKKIAILGSTGSIGNQNAGIGTQASARFKNQSKILFGKMFFDDVGVLSADRANFRSAGADYNMTTVAAFPNGQAAVFAENLHFFDVL